MSRSYLPVHLQDTILGVVADAISSQHPKEEEEWDEKRSMEELGKVDLGRENSLESDILKAAASIKNIKGTASTIYLSQHSFAELKKALGQ